MIGNPFTDKSDSNSRVQFAHRLALLSDELFKVINSVVYLSVYYIEHRLFVFKKREQLQKKLGDEGGQD